jgi:hypothetical protein
MTMDSTKSEIGSSEGGHFLFDDWFDPWKMGCARAFEASSRSFSKPSWTRHWDEIGMNGLDWAAAIRRWGLSAHATAIGNVV